NPARRISASERSCRSCPRRTSRSRVLSEQRLGCHDATAQSRPQNRDGRQAFIRVHQRPNLTYSFGGVGALGRRSLPIRPPKAAAQVGLYFFGGVAASGGVERETQDGCHDAIRPSKVVTAVRRSSAFIRGQICLTPSGEWPRWDDATAQSGLPN